MNLSRRMRWSLGPALALALGLSLWGVPVLMAGDFPHYESGGAKLPPPAPADCVSDVERHAVLRGHDCDCSCEGYASRPGRACMVACGLAYYGCWAPDPTPGEMTRAALSGMDEEMRAALAPELAVAMSRPEWQAGLLMGVMRERALAWDAARRCDGP